MPARVRRKLILLLLVALAVLLPAGAAAGSNGGFWPRQPQSPNAQSISTVYYVILGFTAAIFVLVEGILVAFVWKYRSRGRGRQVEGPQVEGHTRLELIWTVGPVLVLAVIAAVVFYELPGIANAPAATDPIDVTIEGHQYYWQFDYPNGAHSINDLHVPVGAVVNLKVISGDVIHSWWIPQLGGKIQAIPGRTNTTWLRADTAGTYPGQCAELCGLYHASMLGSVVAESADAYHTYVTKTAPATLGKQIFDGVCATCHGMQGQGGYGPELDHDPLLTEKAGLEQIVEQGRLKMPPVGDTWTKSEMDVLAAWVGHHVYKGAASGG